VAYRLSQFCQTIRGTIYLNLNLKQNNFHAQDDWDAIVLNFTGIEHSVIVTETQRKDRNNENGQAHSSTTTHTEYSVDRDSHTLFKYVLPIHRFLHNNKRLPNGQYEYPFEFQLPEDLPASFDFSDTNTGRRRYRHNGRNACHNRNNNSIFQSSNETESHCELEYLVTAVLLRRGGGGGDGFFRSMISSSSRNVVTSSDPQHLEIQQAPRVAVNPSDVLLPERNIPVKFCCCFPMGHVRLQMHVNQTIIGPGSTLAITLDGRNASRFNVEMIHVKLIESIIWRANGRTQERSQELCSGESEELIHNEAWFARPQDHPEYASLSQQQGANNGSNHTICISLQVPSQARMSYQGTVVEVTHSVIVSAQTPGCCFITSPKITREVEVCNLSSPPPAASVPAEAEVVVQPSAPLEEFDNNHYQTSYSSSANVQMVQAEVLPADWNPQTAPLVHISAEQVLLPTNTLDDAETSETYAEAKIYTIT
jgi:hypothetical protein